MMQTEVENEIHREAMATRVALHPVLAGMNGKHLALLTDCAIGVYFNKGQVILKEGEQADRFYLIENGTVNLESGTSCDRPVIIDTIGAGDLLGWSYVFAPYTWQFTARATELMSAIFFYGATLRAYCECDHSLGYELFKRMTAIMTRRMQAARKRMLGLHAGDISLAAIVRSSSVAHDVNGLPNKTTSRVGNAWLRERTAGVVFQR